MDAHLLEVGVDRLEGRRERERGRGQQPVDAGLELVGQGVQHLARVRHVCGTCVTHCVACDVLRNVHSDCDAHREPPRARRGGLGMRYMRYMRCVRYMRYMR